MGAVSINNCFLSKRGNRTVRLLKYYPTEREFQSQFDTVPTVFEARMNYFATDKLAAVSGGKADILETVLLNNTYGLLQSSTLTLRFVLEMSCSNSVNRKYYLKQFCLQADHSKKNRTVFFPARWFCRRQVGVKKNSAVVNSAGS
jgi:hypothetical protein